MNATTYKSLIYSRGGVRQLLSLGQRYAQPQTLGQNFLVDRNLAQVLTNSLPDSCRAILEIGPGFGALTFILAENNRSVLAIEIDHHLFASLRDALDQHAHIQLIHDDFLDISWDSITQHHLNKPLWVVGNLPYSASTPILAKLLIDWQGCWDGCLVMLQKELGQRLVAPAKHTNRSRISVLAQTFGQVTIERTIPPTVFYPTPDVESVWIRISPAPQQVINMFDHKMFLKIVQTAFSQRRKMVGKLLNQLASPPHTGASLCQKSEVNPSLRAQDLTVEDFIRLTQAFTEHQK